MSRRCPPLLIPRPEDHLQPSQIFSFNRALQDLVYEALGGEKGLRGRGWALRVRQTELEEADLRWGKDLPNQKKAYVLFVPVLFNRSRACWNVGCVLNWTDNDVRDEADALASLPWGTRTILAGALYRALEKNRGESLSCLQVVTRQPWHGKGDDRLEFDSEPPLDDPRQILPDWFRGEEVHRAVRDRRPFASGHQAMQKRYFAGTAVDSDGTHHTIVVPIYEHRIFGKGLGNVVAALYLHIVRPGGKHPNATEKDRARWRTYFAGALDATKKLLVPRIHRAAEVLSLELEAAAFAAVSAEPVSAPYDLVTHFLKVLRHVQFWQRAVVLSYGAAEHTFGWTREPATEETKDLASADTFEGIDLGSRTWKLGAGVHAEPTAPDQPALEERWWCGVGSHGHSKPCRDVLWFLRQEPSLTEAERLELEGRSLHFQFPDAAQLPGGGWAEAFDRALVQQQLEVFRLVLPVVRARRAALRSAVSAIMGRNMSHNIGSHVMARYAAVVRKDLSETPGHIQGGGVHADHREDFMRYLQRRMDFIAEIGTTDRANHWQSMSLRDALQALNYSEQQQSYSSSAAAHRQPILLTYISGKDSNGEPLCATVEFEGPDRQFSCPGGETGVHALYVILENIIRNSARHGGPHRKCITVRVSAPINRKDDPWIAVRLIDKGSRIGADRVGAINRHLTQALLDDMNVPEEKHWGLREMQICAAYLRGISLTALEGPEILSVEGAGAPPVLLARSSDSGDLVYEICLQMARPLAVVASASASEPRGAVGPGRGWFQYTEPLNDESVARVAARVRGFDCVLVDEALAGFLAGDTRPAATGWLPVNKRTACFPVRTYFEASPAALSDFEIHARTLQVSLGHTQLAGMYRANGQLQPCVFYGVEDESLQHIWFDHAVEQDFKGVVSTRCRRIVYREHIDNLVPHRAAFDGDEWRKHELLAAARPSVVVLDERIQSASKRKHRNIPLETLWSSSGIHVPTLKDVDLFEPNLKSIQAFLDDRRTSSGRCLDCRGKARTCEAEAPRGPGFLVMHLGIVEKLLLTGDHESVLRTLRDGAVRPHLVLATGRGVPHLDPEMRGEARLIAASTLQEHLVARPSKLGLMRALWASARIER